MKDYFVFELKRFLKNRKSLFMFLALFVFFGAVFYAVTNQGLGDQQRKLDEELNQTRIVTQYTTQYNEENEEAFNLGRNIHKQQHILASQANGITFGEIDWYLESGLELATLRLEMLGNPAFSKLPDSLLPSEDAMQRDLVELEAIEEQGTPLMENAESVSGFAREAILIFGVLAFGYLLIFGSDISMDDFEHGTMIESYPLTSLQKIFSKLTIYSVGVTVMTSLIFLITAALMSFVWDWGNFSYPIGLFSLGNFVAQPLWVYLLIFLFYFFVLAVHTFLLTMALNRYLKHSIATIIVGLLLFILPYIYPPLTNYLSLLPFHYYNITALFNGQFAMEINDWMHIGTGIFLLIVYSILLFFIIIRKDQQQTTVK